MQRASIPAGTTSALNFVPVLDALERLGIETPRVLSLAGTTDEELRGLHARVPLALEFTFWDAVVEHTGDALIALRVAEQIHVGALGAYEYLLRNSPTVRTAIDQAQRFERVMDDLSRIEIIEGESEAAVRLWRKGGWPHPARGTECLFASILRLVGDILPGERVLGLRFAHEPLGDPREFQLRVGCPVAFSQPHNEMVVRKAILDLPLRTADPVLSRVLEEHMTHVLERLPSESAFVQRARIVLGEALEKQAEVSLEQLAQALHLSARTLRRRLEEHGTSYKNLLDDLRRDLARHYVSRTSESFEETGARLGFADVSTFYRAFKRWTSTTPAAYRAQFRSRAP